jgi:hypothetical protein
MLKPNFKTTAKDKDKSPKVNGNAMDMEDANIRAVLHKD